MPTFLFCYIIGLWRDDIISTEPEIIKEALKRLSQQELDDRNWRIERAIQLSTSGQELPPELHSKLEEVSWEMDKMCFLHLGQAVPMEACRRY